MKNEEGIIPLVFGDLDEFFVKEEILGCFTFGIITLRRLLIGDFVLFFPEKFPDRKGPLPLPLKTRLLFASDGEEDVETGRFTTVRLRGSSNSRLKEEDDRGDDTDLEYSFGSFSRSISSGGGFVARFRMSLIPCGVGTGAGFA